MLKDYAKLMRLFYLTGDLLLLNMAFILSYWLKFDGLQNFVSSSYGLLLVYFNILWIGITFLRNNNVYARLDRYRTVFQKAIIAAILHLVVVVVAFWALKNNYFSRLHLGYTYAFFIGGMIAFRTISVYFIRTYRSLGYNQKRVVIVGYNEAGKALEKFFAERPDLGFQFAGYFDPTLTPNNDADAFLQKLDDFLANNETDEVLFTLSIDAHETLNAVRKIADKHLLRVKTVTTQPDFDSFRVESYGTVPLVPLRHEPLTQLGNRIIKRSFDIVFASLVLVFILSWLIPLIGLIIKLDSKGPVFFRQKRSGRDGKHFLCYKFRTMTYQKNATFVQATKNDSRVTRVGKFLRKTNLDELPQFINVFLGDMTVVGPRPHPIPLDEQFKVYIDKYVVRHLVKPGVTGLAQAKGLRGETRDVQSMHHRIRMDIFYVENWSFWFDLKIIVMTVVNMLVGDKNAY